MTRKKNDSIIKSQPGRITSNIYGKIPPHAADLEEEIIGTILQHPETLDIVRELLKPEMFYLNKFQQLFGIMVQMNNKGLRPDLISVIGELVNVGKLEELGGAYEITKTTNRVIGTHNLESHCKILIQFFLKREIIRVGGELFHLGYSEEDAFELLGEAEKQFTGISSSISVNDMKESSEVVMSVLKKIDEWGKLDSAVTGVTSGYSGLDRMTRGWQPGDLIILAARPSVGKTAFALNLVRNAASSGKGVALWSLEMKSELLALRLLAAMSEEYLLRLQTGKLSADQNLRLHNAAVKLSELKIYYNDQSGATIRSIASKARKLKRQGKIGMILIDYLQLVTGDGKQGTREQEISTISRELKKLAQELEIPIIALSQLSRDVEKRTGKKAIPMLSDLRESGAIEQDADVVGFLYGPQDDEIQENPELKDIRYLKIAKQRNGVLGTVTFNFKDAIQLFNEKVEEESNWKPVQAAMSFEKGGKPF